MASRNWKNKHHMFLLKDEKQWLFTNR